MAVIPSLTSDKNRLIRGTLLPHFPNQIRLSATYSLKRSLVKRQQYPLGGYVSLPEGVMMGYTLLGIIGPTERLPDCHGPRGSLSGFLYLASAESVRGSLLS